ncbi:SpoIIE-like protein phosphatase domain protein [Leptospira inadai serovar Lyme str. 10]|uniref:SpoIIE-like protein phosphatase domain protein n=1 Tax=Leptospira inadai serovar Lyme str. 10 TaxID=1049790 RepID=V6HFK5_9LEPT|nr:response regulator [Leptospira inadai]EQA38503.1 SpoIIE-like protein phosphatase domain protein [Leptospira inadai serovar Lyme str. 10]
MTSLSIKPEILIIDDDRDVGEALEILLQKLGYNSTFFDSVDRGKEYFEKEANPIVFLDIHMPHTSGLDVLPYFKNLNPATQVIMMTGERDINNVVTSLTHKASDFLLKPFSLQTVRIAVQRALDYYTLLKEQQAREESILRDLRLASKIQRKILSVPDFSPYKVLVDNTPASFVSGDFYVLSKSNGTVLALLGDIEDHGVTSGLIGLLMTSIAREAYKEKDDPSHVLRRMNEELSTEIGTHSLTAAVVVIKPEKKRLLYARGGHPFPVLYRKEGMLLLKEKSGQLLGIMDQLEFEAHEVPFQSGDILFLYSDGLLNNLSSPLFSELDELRKKDRPIEELEEAIRVYSKAALPTREFRDDSSYMLIQL